MKSIIYELWGKLDISRFRFLSLCLTTVLSVADAGAASCSSGVVQKISAVNLKTEHFSWYQTERKSFFDNKKTKIIEAQIYNASSENKLGFFLLNITLENGIEIPLNSSVSNVQIGPLQTALIQFNAPGLVVTNRARARLEAQLFKCQVPKFDPTQPFVIEPPKVILGQPVKRSFSFEELKEQKELEEQQKAEKIRRAEIYDNCIIDLMPDTATRVKQASIMDKCERISENPSWLDNLKY